MRPIKFRGRELLTGRLVYSEFLGLPRFFKLLDDGDIELIGQFTGLHDKNGKEIYELMEINGTQRVVYKAPAYVLQDISTGDILEIDNSNLKQYEITGEYSPI